MTNETDDFFQSTTWKTYANRAITDLVPKLKGSEVSAVLAGDLTNGGDAKLAIEIGFTLLMGKPLILIAGVNDYVPESLLRAADLVLRGDMADDSFRQEFGKAVHELIHKAGQN